MNQFTQYAPTEIIFGVGTEVKTGTEVRKWGGSRVFVVYGGGSVIRSGLMGRVEASLKDAELEYELCGGVQPNPRLAFAEEARKKAEAFGADFLLAVGGGSSIDTAKAVAHGLANPGVALWDIWTGKVPLEKSTPVAAILTIPAAGSEMSDSAVLTNEEAGIKSGISTPFNRCKFAIMNPDLPLTLPDYQLSCGICDIMMHTLDRYFIPKPKCDLTDEIAEGLLRTVIRNGKLALEDRSDDDAMGEIMWASSISHNGMTGLGRARDFSVHKFGHALSARYDITHGASLAAVWGSWATFLYKDAPERFAQYARNVWGVKEEDDLRAARAGIQATVDYFRSIKLPVCLPDLNLGEITETDLDALAADATKNDTVKLTQIKPVGYAEALEIFRMANVPDEAHGAGYCEE